MYGRVRLVYYGAMRKPHFSVYALVAILLFACGKPETPAPAPVRSVEPRLSGTWTWQACDVTMPPGRVVAIAQCGAHIATPPVSLSAEGCDDMTGTYQQTLETLAKQPACTDAAVVALERFSINSADAGQLSDLAAAYYVRAQRQDRPKDLLEALKRVDAALTKAPAHSAALFNRALVLEALSLREDAIPAWDHASRTGERDWDREASAHREQLKVYLTRDAAVQWPLVKARLAKAVAAGDRATIDKAVDGYSNAVEQYVEDELLPVWAETDSAETLALAEALANAMNERKHDPYLHDIVQVIVQSGGNPQKRSALRAAHRTYKKGRDASVAMSYSEAAPLHAEARRLFSAAGSPLENSAAVSFAVAAFRMFRDAEAFSALNGALQAADARHYQHLLGWAHGTHAYLLGSSLDKAQEEYTRARDIYASLGSSDGVAQMTDGRAGMYRFMGLREKGWREALHAVQLSPAVVETQQRHRIRGEVASALVELNFPEAALLYQNVTVDMIRTAGLRNNLPTALRARAGMELLVGQVDRAERDLNEATALVGDQLTIRDAAIVRSLNARINEVRGQLALRRGNPTAAINDFTAAVRDGRTNEYRTLRVRLYTQRAEARRKAGEAAEATNDLRLALDELRAEETQVLADKRRGDWEEVNNVYFSRFDETYNRLIDELTAQHRDADAFNYAERARAVEPLSLLMQLKVVPAAFRTLTHNGQTLELPAIQAQLPAGTFLLQYRVTPDHTYAWLISRDSFKSMRLEVRPETIARWTRTLQDAVPYHPKLFDDGLIAPYEQLLRQPLAAMQQLPGGSDPDNARLVIIPDGPMHGLPFAALRDTNGQYLIQKTIVSVDASATLYVFSLLRDRALAATKDDTALLVGNPAFDKTTGLPNLPAAGAEVDDLRALYPRGESLRDGDATIERFFAAASNSTIIHFAGHAVTNAERPRDSELLFANIGLKHGHLTAAELLKDAKLDRTRLVVLAACSSAGGAPVGPDGLAPLVRPFVAAGVPAVVGSLWNVGDATSAELLLTFHQHFHDGLDAASALRKAQLSALREGGIGIRQPFTWAAFQVIGHSNSPFAPTTQ